MSGERFGNKLPTIVALVEKMMVTKSRRSKARRESGQSMLELALLTPIVLLMLLGVIELGRYAYMVILVTNAARAGAAYGSESLAQSADTAGIASAVQNDFQQYSGEGGVTVTSSTSCGCESGGSMPPVSGGSCTVASEQICAQQWVVTVSVTANGSFHSLFQIPSIFGFAIIPKTYTTTSTATMVVAND